MPDNIDSSKLIEALKSLLRALPNASVLEVDRMSAAELKRLRADIDDVLERLLPISRNLDPIKQPAFVFDPTNPEIVGQPIGRTMMEQPSHPLGAVPKIYGSGIYALYYGGNFDAYRPIRRKHTPIYVGKADPPTPDARTPEEQGPKLWMRLTEHAKSVRAAVSSLNIDDFGCRFLVVQSGWQRSAEDYLVNLFKPIWNLRTCYGFGKHGDAPTTRANTRSPWDTPHPGRSWATREGNVPSAFTVEQIKEQIADHFRRHPPKSDQI